MKTTTTLYEIIHSELIGQGHDEFVNNNRLVFQDSDFSFINKIMVYDEDVQAIVDDLFFKGLKLDNVESDKKFKRTFINKFYNREIAFQTLENFAAQMIYVTLSNIDYINTVYDNIEDFILGKKENTSNTSDSNTSDNRNLTSTLPQSNVNLNVDNSELDFGDTNTIQKTKTTSNNNNESTNVDYNLDNLLKSSALLEHVFIEYDKKCFLQIW